MDKRINLFIFIYSCPLIIVFSWHVTHFLQLQFPADQFDSSFELFPFYHGTLRFLSLFLLWVNTGFHGHFGQFVMSRNLDNQLPIHVRYCGFPWYVPRYVFHVSHEFSSYDLLKICFVGFYLTLTHFSKQNKYTKQVCICVVDLLLTQIRCSCLHSGSHHILSMVQ